ncbi:hypothetical protein ACFL5K_04380 [Gemmatimonadota bacterium]
MHKPIRLFLLIASLLVLAACAGGNRPYPMRWFYLNSLLESDAAVDSVGKVVRLAAEHGLNGMLMFSKFDYISLQDDTWKARLVRVKQICDNAGVELVPRCLDMGYNDETILHHDPNLAEGLPVKDAIFEVQGGEAHLVPDPEGVIVNGSFELYGRDLPEAFEPSDPGYVGSVLFVDKGQASDGQVSLRVEIPRELPEETALLSTRVPVKPRRCYRLSCMVRSTEIRDGGDVFPLMVRSVDGHRLNYQIPKLQTDGEWFRVDLGFNSLDRDSVVISVTAPAVSGTFWVDDLHLEEVALVNVLRRSGAPLVVRGEDGTVFEEGVDFAPVADSGLDFSFSHPGARIVITSGSRIREGQRLLVSFYHGTTIYHHQVVACMSEPEVYEIWAEQVCQINALIAPKKYFLSVDELRMAGSCNACRERGLTPAQLVTDCVKRQVEIVRAVNPRAELLIWSDMFDPYHNADRRDRYYLASGDFYGSWESLPRDLIVACWHHGRRQQSLGHFTGLGFRTLACGYYDAKNLQRDRTWLEALNETPGAQGIMYTTWSNNYSLLSEFGDMVSAWPAKAGR